MSKITLKNGSQILLDKKDYLRLKNNTWCVSGNKHVATPQGWYIHYAVLDIPPTKGFEIDHIDGNPLNNQKNNLRLVTRQQNSANHFKSTKAFSSKYKGVHNMCNYYKKKIYKYWIANICVNYKTIYLGIFKNEKQAAKAYNKAAKKYFGEYARINNV